MRTLELSEEECAELKSILTSYLSDLRMEIADTESFDFRQGLKRREVFLKKLLHSLE